MTFAWEQRGWETSTTRNKIYGKAIFLRSFRFRFGFVSHISFLSLHLMQRTLCSIITKLSQAHHPWEKFASCTHPVSVRNSHSKAFLRKSRDRIEQDRPRDRRKLLVYFEGAVHLQTSEKSPLLRKKANKFSLPLNPSEHSLTFSRFQVSLGVCIHDRADRVPVWVCVGFQFTGLFLRLVWTHSWS